jgi:HSP20 family protein
MANAQVPATTSQQQQQQNLDVARGPSLVPAVDIYENEKEILLIADLPAVPQEGLTVEIDRQELRIEGKRMDDRTYRRMFVVPDGIDTNSVKADLSNGILKVTLPKLPEVQARKVTVNAK